MVDRYSMIESPCPTTCNWLFSTDQFRKWESRVSLEEHHGVLWIKGKPGAGKSTLMKHCLERCNKLFQDHIIVKHFFNAQGDALERTTIGLLRSLLCQILQHDGGILQQFLPIYLDKVRWGGREGWQWRAPELRSFLLSEVRAWRSPPLLLLVDALDECDHSEVRETMQFFEKLSDEAVQGGMTLRICISSRRYPTISIRRALELVVEDNQEHGEDIRTYIHEELRVNDEDLEDSLHEKASGVFLWVVIVVVMLNKASDEGDVKAMWETLDKVPSSLMEVFESLLQGEGPIAEDTMLMLQWVLLSPRRLSPVELYYAIESETNASESRSWDRNVVTMDVIQRRITSLSKGLLELQAMPRVPPSFVDARYTEHPWVWYVRFIHQSVSDFLLRRKTLQKLDRSLGSDPISASHGRLWIRCRSHIDLLVGKDVSSHGLDSHCPFVNNAAEHVFYHAELSNGATEASMIEWLRQRDSWLPVWKALVKRREPYWTASSFLNFQKNTSMLYIVCLLGHCKVAELLLRTEKADPNVQEKDVYGNALQAAAAGGHEGVVSLLIQNGADVDAKGGMHGTALQAACAKGHRAIVELLLRNKADVNARGGAAYVNPLHTAAAEGRKEICEMLLDHGADIDTKCVINGGVLQAATMSSNREVFQMLIAHGADINTKGGVCGTALQATAIERDFAHFMILIDHGADVNIQGGIYGTALQAALGSELSSNDTRVETLLEKGASVDAPGGLYGNALRAAVHYQKFDHLELLLEASCIETRASFYGFPLQEAIANGSPEKIESLLSEESNVNIQGGVYGSALEAAAALGQEETVQLLLKNKADVNMQGGLYGTALQAAVYRGHDKIAKILIDSGAGVNARGGVCGTALQAAAEGGHKDILKELLEQGADVNITGGFFGCAICAAVSADEWGDSTACFDLLLEIDGLNVNSQGGLLGTQLQVAAISGNEDMCRKLLGKGADVHAQGGIFGSALRAASVGGDTDVVSILLEHGAEFEYPIKKKHTDVRLILSWGIASLAVVLGFMGWAWS